MVQRLRRRRSLFKIVHARGAIPNEVVKKTLSHNASLEALHKSADVTRTPASQCLPAMPLPPLHSCLEAASADCPPRSRRRSRKRSLTRGGNSFGFNKGVELIQEFGKWAQDPLYACDGLEEEEEEQQEKEVRRRRRRRSRSSSSSGSSRQRERASRAGERGRAEEGT